MRGLTVDSNDGFVLLGKIIEAAHGRKYFDNG